MRWDATLQIITDASVSNPKISFDAGNHLFQGMQILDTRTDTISEPMYVSSNADSISISGNLTLGPNDSYDTIFEIGNTSFSLKGNLLVPLGNRKFRLRKSDIILNGTGDQIISLTESFIYNGNFISQKESGNLSISGPAKLSIEKSNPYSTLTVASDNVIIQ